MPKFMSNRLSAVSAFNYMLRIKEGAPASAAARARRQSSPQSILFAAKGNLEAPKLFFAAQMIKSRYSIKKMLHNLQLARHL